MGFGSKKKFNGTSATSNVKHSVGKKSTLLHKSRNKSKSIWSRKHLEKQHTLTYHSLKDEEETLSAINNQSFGANNTTGTSIKQKNHQRSFTYDERLLLSRYGLYLLMGLTKHTDNAPYEEFGRLLAALFQWFDSTAYLPEGGVATSIETLKSTKICDWIKEKTTIEQFKFDWTSIKGTCFDPMALFGAKNIIPNADIDFDGPICKAFTNRFQQIFMLCLSPRPPDFAKSIYDLFIYHRKKAAEGGGGGSTSSGTANQPNLLSGLVTNPYLTKNKRQRNYDFIEAGLFRLFCLIPYDLIEYDAWQLLMPQWMQALVWYSDALPCKNTDLQVLLKKTFDLDMSPLQFEPNHTMFDFIKNRLLIDCWDVVGGVEKIENIFYAFLWIEFLTTSKVALPLEYLLKKAFLPLLESLKAECFKSPKLFDIYNYFTMMYGYPSSLNPNKLYNENTTLSDLYSSGNDDDEADNEEIKRKLIMREKTDKQFADWWSWHTSNVSTATTQDLFLARFAMHDMVDPLNCIVALLIRVLVSQLKLQNPTLPYDPDNKKVQDLLMIVRRVQDIIFLSIQRRYEHNILIYTSETSFHNYWHLIDYILTGILEIGKFVCPEYEVFAMSKPESISETQSSQNFSSRDSGEEQVFSEDFDSETELKNKNRYVNKQKSGDVSSLSKTQGTPSDHVHGRPSQTMTKSLSSRLSFPDRLSGIIHRRKSSVKSSKFRETTKGLMGQTPLQIMTATVSMYCPTDDTDNEPQDSTEIMMDSKAQKTGDMEKGYVKKYSNTFELDQMPSTSSSKEFESIVSSTESAKMENIPFIHHVKQLSTDALMPVAESTDMHEYIVPQSIVASTVDGSTVQQNLLSEIPMDNLEELKPFEQNDEYMATPQNELLETGSSLNPVDMMTVFPQQVSHAMVIDEPKYDTIEVIKPVAVNQGNIDRDQLKGGVSNSLGTPKEKSPETKTKWDGSFDNNKYLYKDLMADTDDAFWKTSKGEFRIIFAELQERFKVIYSAFRLLHILKRDLYPLSSQVGGKNITAEEENLNLHNNKNNEKNATEKNLKENAWKLSNNSIDVLLKYRIRAMYQCLHFLNNCIITGQYMLDIRGENRGFIIWFQENLVVPTLCDILALSDSYLNQLAVPLLNRCINYPNGRSQFWKFLFIRYFNQDWKIRLPCIVSLQSFFQCINVFGNETHIKEESENCIAYAFCVLAYSLFDSNLHLSQLVRLSFHTLPFAAFKTAIRCLEWQYSASFMDRSLILNITHSLLNIFKTRCLTKHLNGDFYIVYLYLNLADLILNVTEQSLIEQYIPYYDKNKNPPLHGFRPIRKDRKLQISRFNEVLVSLTTSNTVFSIKKCFALIDKINDTSNNNITNKNNIGFPSQINSPPSVFKSSVVTSIQFSLDSFILAKNGGSSEFSNSRSLDKHNITNKSQTIESPYCGMMKEFDDDQVSSLINTLYDSCLQNEDISYHFNMIMKIMMHLITFLDPTKSGKYGKRVTSLQNETLTYLSQLLYYRSKDNYFALSPRLLRQCSLHNTFLAEITQLLDFNVNMGYKLLVLVLDLLYSFCTNSTYSSDSIPKTTQDTLNTLSHFTMKLWIKALTIIYFKYEIDDKPIYAKAELLASIIINTLKRKLNDDKTNTTEELITKPDHDMINDKTRNGKKRSETEHLSSTLSFESLNSLLHKRSKASTLNDKDEAITKTEDGINPTFGLSPQPFQTAKLSDASILTLTPGLYAGRNSTNLSSLKTPLPVKSEQDVDKNFQTESRKRQQEFGTEGIMQGIKAFEDLQEDTISLSLVCLEVFVRRCEIMATPHLIDIIQIAARLCVYSFYPCEQSGDPISNSNMHSSSIYGNLAMSLSPGIQQGGANISSLNSSLTFDAANQQQNTASNINSAFTNNAGGGNLTNSNNANQTNNPSLSFMYPSNAIGSANLHVASNETFFIPGHCRSIAQQMLRCILHQYAPNRLFLRLFSTFSEDNLMDNKDNNFGEPLKLFQIIVDVLRGFPDFGPLNPLLNMLQDFESEKGLSGLSKTKLNQLLQNLSDYLEYVILKERLSLVWKSHIFSHFEPFFEALSIDLNPNLEQGTANTSFSAPGSSNATLNKQQTNQALNKKIKIKSNYTILNIILALLKIPSITHFRNLLDSFGKILTACLRIGPVDIEQLWEMCYLCNTNISFIREREKHLFTRLIISELMSVLAFKKVMAPLNLLTIIQLILIDMGFNVGSYWAKVCTHKPFVPENDFGKQEVLDIHSLINSGISESMKHIFNDLINFLSDIENISVLTRCYKAFPFSYNMGNKDSELFPPFSKDKIEEKITVYVVPEQMVAISKKLDNPQSPYTSLDPANDNLNEKDIINDSIQNPRIAQITSNQYMSDNDINGYTNIRELLTESEDNLGSMVKMGIAQIIAWELSKETEKLYRHKSAISGINAASKLSTKRNTYPLHIIVSGPSYNYVDIDLKTLISQTPAWLRNHFGFLYQKRILSHTLSPPTNIGLLPNTGPLLPAQNSNTNKNNSTSHFGISNRRSQNASVRKQRSSSLIASANIYRNKIRKRAGMRNKGTNLLRVGAHGFSLSNPLLSSAAINIEQQGIREFNDINTNIRLCSWTLLGTLQILNLNKPHAGGALVCQPFLLDHHAKISDLILNLFAKFPEYASSNILHTTSLFFGFFLCLIWTVYNEFIIGLYGFENEYSYHAENSLLSFWCQIIPGLIQFVTMSKTYPEMVSLHLLSIIETLQEINSSSLIKLFPLLRPLLHYQDQMPSHLRIRLHKALSWAPQIELNTNDFYFSIKFLEWITKLQFKLSKMEVQSTMAIHIYTI